MIDIKELRRLAQAAMTGPDGVSLNWVELLRDFQKEAGPAAVSELLDRLEEAESDAIEQARLNGMGSEREAALMAKLEAAERDRATFIMGIGNLCTKVEALREELSKQQSLSQAAQQLAEVAQRRADALRAKIEQMEKQEPVGTLHDDGRFVWRETAPHQSNYAGWKMALYARPGAQNVPVEHDEPVRKSWARFSNELHRSPDAPYPGMSEAFEQHFSQSFTDREWRAESATWAAAWKAAKRHGAQPAPSTPEVTDAMAIAFHCALTDVSIGEHEVEEIKKGLRAALEAAPEAKP